MEARSKEIVELDPDTQEERRSLSALAVFPATHFLTVDERLRGILTEIEKERDERVKELKNEEKIVEAQRLKGRVDYDLEMIREPATARESRTTPATSPGAVRANPRYTLLDFFPDDFLAFIDESHVTIPQLQGMYKGDRSRKDNLVEFGWRLPSARDNRPLKFPEFLTHVSQTVFVSATPGPFERKASKGIVEQIIRPTGLVDPPIEVRPLKGHIADLMTELRACIERGDRGLVTTLTKATSEELANYLANQGFRVRYLHSEVETMKRVEILRDLRLGQFDVLVGINLLREGLDLPEVSFVAILDADKEGFLRSETSIIQTAGRTSRNVEGRVVLYADRMHRIDEARDGRDGAAAPDPVRLQRGPRHCSRIDPQGGPSVARSGRGGPVRGTHHERTRAILEGQDAVADHEPRRRDAPRRGAPGLRGGGPHPRPVARDPTVETGGARILPEGRGHFVGKTAFLPIKDSFILGRFPESVVASRTPDVTGLRQGSARGGTVTELLFLYECATLEPTQLRPIAERLGLTVQAVSHSYRELRCRGLATVENGRYRPTVEGVAWLHETFRRLGDDLRRPDRAGPRHPVDPALALEDLSEGAVVSLELRHGLLSARLGSGGPSRGRVQKGGRKGSLVEVSDLAGIVPLTPAPISVRTLTTKDLADPRLGARIRDDLPSDPLALVAADGLEAFHALSRPVLARSCVPAGSACLEAARLGVPSYLLVLEGDLPHLLNQFAGPSPPPLEVAPLPGKGRARRRAS